MHSHSTPAETYDALRPKLRGELILKGDARYDSARALFNAMIDKKPAAIAQCVDAADVMACIDFARTQKILLAVRGGGHNGPGLGSCDDGLVIDLSRMRSVHVDPVARTATVGGGAVWGDVDHATHAFGLAAVSGIISSTGVGGLTLGGGIGYLARQYGLTVDHLLAVDMVLADGRFVTADAERHPDLFWAVRGGGGNFGVVTRFTFRLHPVDTVLAGPIFWALEDAPAVMRAYESFIKEAPEDINGFFAFLTVPPVDLFPAELHLRKVCGIVWCSTADEARTSAYIKTAESWAKPLLSGIGPMPFPAVQRMFDGLYAPGMQWYWKADFVDHLSDEAITLHVQQAQKMPSLFSTMHLYPINGAVHRVAEGATAFNYRKTTWAKVIVGVDPDPANADMIRQWTVDYYDATHPYSAGGAYVNFMMDEGQERVQATYGANYDRLTKVKAAYDPDNTFHVNQNIRPA